MPKSTSSPYAFVIPPSTLDGFEEASFFNNDVTLQLEINKLRSSSNSCLVESLSKNTEFTISRNDVKDYFPKHRFDYRVGIVFFCKSNYKSREFSANPRNIG